MNLKRIAESFGNAESKAVYRLVFEVRCHEALQDAADADIPDIGENFEEVSKQ